ncbi:MAG: aminoglycoside 3-N-acetyltransferase [Humisphaera sp.]|nr:aminoglycoside 3-N-acetyltransferase [Humisphaera sp.]
MSVTRDGIVNAIRSLGVRPGDFVIAHSSYKSFGPGGVEGGPAVVAAALVDAVSPGGSVFVPAFNYGNDAYDPATAPSYDGVITEFFRTHPDAVRSLHPTHSLAGVGPDAATILAGHEMVHAFAAGSPVWRLWERNAWVLLIGVGHFANSMAHVAEELLAMPYLDRKRRARVVRSDGTIAEVELRRPGCSDAWDAVLGPPLRARGAIVEGKIGDARLQLMRARDVVDATAELLRRNSQTLLCNRPGCDACEAARKMLGAKPQAR